MNRELKFRKWNGKKMLLVQRLIWSTLDDDLFAFEEGSGDLDCSSALMQYTGLTDKFNVEIYEGDILSIRKSKTVTRRCVVEWDGSGWYLKPSAVRSTLWNVHHKAKVIGNRFENPELLGAKS